MTKKVSKIVLYSIGAVVLILVSLALYSQTEWFRSNLRSALYRTISSNVNASVYLGEIEGNLVSGFSIDTVMIYVDNAPFIESGRISARYDLLELLRKNIVIDSLVIENPSVNLVRSKSGVWNVDRLDTTFSPPDSAPSSIVIDARSIVLRNASFRMIDSTGDVSSSVIIDGRKSLNYSNVKITRLNLDAKALFSPSRLAASIKRLSFESPRETFTLQQLSASVVHTKDTTIVKDLDITTPDSHLLVDASMTGIDVIGVKDLKEFQNIPTRAAIISSSIAMADLHTFLPELYFFRGKMFLDTRMQGTFDQLNFKQLEASFDKTILHLSGTLSNLHTPKDLHLNVVSKQSSINPPDIAALMPYFGIPEFPSLGMITMDFQYVGKPLDFMIISTVKSTAGTMTVDGEMLITEKNLHYKGLLGGNNVNLEKLFASSELASVLNTKIYVEGEGTSIDKLSADARIQIDSSSFRGIPVSTAGIELMAKEKRIQTKMNIVSPEGNIVSSGTMNFTSAVPTYSLAAQVRNLNLAPVVKDDYYRSQLSFNVERSAESFDILNGNSHTVIHLFPSTFQEYSIDSSFAEMSVSVDSVNKRTISVQSPIADGSISGFFTFDGFLKSLQTNLKKLNSLYAYQRQVVDSGFVAAKDSAGQADIDTTQHRMEYNFAVKDLRPIGVFFRLPAFDAQGTISGLLEGNRNNSSLSGEMKLKRVVIDQDSISIQGKDVDLQYSIADAMNHRVNPVLPLKADVHSTINELQVGSTRLRFVNVQMDLGDSMGTISAYADIDTTISIGAEGNILVFPSSEQFNFSKLQMKYQGYSLENKNIISVQMDRNGISVDSAEFKHRDQDLFITGRYEYNGKIDAAARVTNFDFSDINYFGTSADFRDYALRLGGSLDAEAQLRGSLTDPAFRVTVQGDSLSYQHSPWGNLDAVIEYAKTLASLNVEISNQNDTVRRKDVTLQGTIPVDLRLVDVPNRLGLKGLDMHLQSSNLQFSALDPFIPELTEIQGAIKSDIHVIGSIQEPVLSGTAQLDKAHFVFEMNGLMYEAEGKLEFDSNKVRFPSLSIKNTAADYNVGEMTIGGFIVMNGFVPNEYHLSAKGELLVLSDRSRAQGSAFFGSLVANTGTDRLRFDGSFEKSKVTGIVYVEQASLTFPPTQQAASYTSSTLNNVEFVNDTSKQSADTAFVNAITNAVQRVAVVPVKNKRTFLDGFGYELTIQTQGPVRVNMIFNANAGSYEELYAELNGKLLLSKDENGMQLKGTINVGSESNYTFYKKFNAGGSLTFVGDPQNPQLNIVATYEGTHQDINDEKKVERVVVTLNITGNRNQPKIKLGLKTIDKSGKETERTGDVDNDAISFLLTSSPGTSGKFRDELTADDQKRIADQISTMSLTFVNSMLSSYVMGFVQKNNIPFVKSFEVRQVGADPDLRIGAEVFDAYLNVGGRVFSDVNNANVSLQVPLGDRQKRDFMLEVEKKTENFDYSTQSRTSIGARIYYRFTF
jgi:autotransporter translocation and assembly factor TamB